MCEYRNVEVAKYSRKKLVSMESVSLGLNSGSSTCYLCELEQNYLTSLTFSFLFSKMEVRNLPAALLVGKRTSLMRKCQFFSLFINRDIYLQVASWVLSKMPKCIPSVCYKFHTIIYEYLNINGVSPLTLIQRNICDYQLESLFSLFTYE